MESQLISTQDRAVQRTAWALPCDWERHRERIINLYKFQDHTLRDVMQIMKQQHCFVATTKMYKYHLRKWGVQKNLRAAQVRELLLQARKGVHRQAAEVSIGGIRVDQERLRNLFKRAAKPPPVRGRTGPSNADNITPSPPPPPPSVQHNPSPGPARLSPPQSETEQVLHALRSYVSGSFDAGRWTRAHIPWQYDVMVSAHNCAWSAGRLMNSGHFAQSFRLLNVCMDSCRRLLAAQTPYFPVGMYAMLFEFSKRHGAVARAIISFLRDLALVVLGSRRHPVYLLFDGMRRMTADDMCRSAWALSQSYQNALLGELGELGPASPSAAQMAALRGTGTSWIAAYGRADDRSIELALHDNLRDVSRGGGGSFETLEARLRIANFMLDRGRYAEAREAAGEVLSLVGDGRGAQDAYLADDCCRILFWTSRHGGDPGEAAGAARRWVEVCTTRLGPAHELTVDALGEVAEYLSDAGDGEAAIKARLDHDSAVGSMCERLECRGLDGDGAFAPQKRTMLYGRTSQRRDISS